MSCAELGCLISHYNVLSKTKSKYTLVLEDDFELCENFDSKLQQCLDELPADFNALWLGGRTIGDKKDYSKNLYSIKAITGTYGYIVNAKFIPALLRALARQNKLADYAMSSVFENVYKSKENLVKHRNGFSEIKQTVVNYPDLA